MVFYANFKIDPGIEYVIEPPRSPEIPLPQSIIPQELDKHDYTLIGSKLLAEFLTISRRK